MEDRGRLDSERAVHIDREAVVPLHQPVLLDMTDQVEQLLRTSHRKRRQNDIAPTVQRLLDNACQVGHMVVNLAMQTISVGGFHHDIIRLVNVVRVADQRLLIVADVAGEHDLLRDVALGDENLDA